MHSTYAIFYVRGDTNVLYDIDDNFENIVNSFINILDQECSKCTIYHKNENIANDGGKYMFKLPYACGNCDTKWYIAELDS